MKIVVTGGAGYIGSFMTRALIEIGDEVTVLDNLERGHEEVIDKRANFVKGDIRDENLLDKLFSNEKYDAILHFAGLISVEESTKNPDLYNDVNVNGSNNLFKTALRYGIRNFIFSSTAAVYGNPNHIPITEDHDKNPTSPYGESKLKIERNLSNLKKDYPDMSFACLRYFNASGASLNGEYGEMHSPETHIIPLAIKAALNGNNFKLFGTDYDTPDGTCLRDYIHVLDLVEAHILALNKIINVNGEYYFNVGTGEGVSNKEVLEMIMKISGKKINLEIVPRRSGDADKLIADPTKIKNELNFLPKNSDLETIIKSAFLFHSSH